MRTYELVTILSPMLNQDQAAEAWSRIKEFITVRDGEITREQSWGTRRLAYPIRKGSINFLEGSYYLTQFATDRPFNFDLELFLHRDERVLRSLVTVADPNAPMAQPGMAAAAAAAARAAAEAAAEAAAAAGAAEGEAATEETAAPAGPAVEAQEPGLGTAGPEASGPETAGPGAAEPVIAGPGAAEPDAAEPGAAEPDAAVSDAGEGPVVEAAVEPATAAGPADDEAANGATEAEPADEPESPALEASSENRGDG